MGSDSKSSAMSAGELRIVDVDSHISPDIRDDLVPYMDQNDGARQLIKSSKHVRSDIFTTTRATPSFPDDVAKGQERAGYDGNDPKGKLGFMEEFDINYSILTPSGGGGGAIATVNHDPTAISIMKAYNEWLSDTWLDAGDGLKVSILVANQRPSLAAEEIDRWGSETNVVGVQFPGAGLVPPAGHHSYDVIYDAAQANDLPIVMHSHDLQAAQTFPVQRRWAETFTESHAFTFPVEAMWHVISLICNGVPVKFPDLDFVFQEPGFEWVPWLMWRLDDHYLQVSRDLPMLSKLPSEYIKDQFNFATQPLGHTDNKNHMGWLMDVVDAGRVLMYSSDHPHPDFDPPSEVLAPAKTQLDAAGIRGLMGENAINTYGLH